MNLADRLILNADALELLLQERRTPARGLMRSLIADLRAHAVEARAMENPDRIVGVLLNMNNRRAA